MCSESLIRTVVITGGPIFDEAASLILPEDKVICADSGVDYAIKNNIRIDEVMGDLDSISAEGKEYLNIKNVPVNVYPVEKDATDTEIALRTCDPSSEILLICSLEGRPDHVRTNVDLIARLREEGRRIICSDGHTDIIPLSGDDFIRIKDMIDSSEKAVSLIPVTREVLGVTTEGLYYELKDATLKRGSSFSNSNELKKDSTSFSVGISEGTLLVIITKRV